MSTSETSAAYSYRAVGPDVLERASQQVVKLEVWYQGSLVAPDSGTLSLLGPDGTAHVDAQSVTVSGNIAQYTIGAVSIPASLALGRLYQLKWVLSFGSETRTIVRNCSLSLRQMVLPVADGDLTREYPDLLVQMGDYATTLQGFIELAKDDVLRELSKSGQWVHIIVGASTLYEVIRQRALYHSFKFLFRLTSGDNRFERLMDDHRDDYGKELDTLVARFDRTGDGLADGEAAEKARRPIHIGGAPRRNRGYNPAFGGYPRRKMW